jgi:hypothetical protein
MYQEPSCPAVAVVGSWDPLLPHHEQLFGFLHTYAQQTSLSSVVIMLDPPPQLLLNGRSRWPLYEDANVRVRRILSSGIDALLRIDFDEADLVAGAAELLELASSHMSMAEFWLGATQSLGRGPSGDQAAVQRLAEEYGMTFKRLPKTSDAAVSSDVRWHLLLGTLTKAIMLTRRPPVWSRPQERYLQLAWAPGYYKAVPLIESLEDLNINAEDREPTMTVSFVPGIDGMPCAEWPDQAVEHLAFVFGPKDQK